MIHACSDLTRFGFIDNVSGFTAEHDPSLDVIALKAILYILSVPLYCPLEMEFISFDVSESYRTYLSDPEPCLEHKQECQRCKSEFKRMWFIKIIPGDLLQLCEFSLARDRSSH